MLERERVRYTIDLITDNRLRERVSFLAQKAEQDFANSIIIAFAIIAIFIIAKALLSG